MTDNEVINRSLKTCCGTLAGLQVDTCSSQIKPDADHSFDNYAPDIHAPASTPNGVGLCAKCWMSTSQGQTAFAKEIARRLMLVVEKEGRGD